MLTITQLPNKKLSIKADYYYRGRIKNIPTAIFDPNTKEWIIEDFALGLLENEFNGELVYKTPRWVILNQKMPDMSDMYKIHNSSISVPILKLKPYDYQEYGIKFMIDKINRHGFVLNADSVGMGKTFQTIATLKWFIDNKNINKILIVCKKSIKKQWVDEFSKFTDLNTDFVIEYTGKTPSKRNATYNNINNSNKAILVTNYHTFLNDTDKIKNLNFDFVVIDETHVVKARNGKLNNNIAKVVRGLPTIFLTGTPIMSRPEDIFGIIQISEPKYFGKYSDFKDEFLTIDYSNRFGAKIVGAKNLDKLRMLVQDIVIRRTEYEVSVQLPQIIVQTKTCDMDKTQETILIEIQKKQDEINNMIESLKQRERKPNEDKLIIAQTKEKLEAQSKSLIAARQAASTDPRMFNLSTSKMMKNVYGKLIPKTYKMSDKVESIIETVEDIINDGDKVILFTKFKTCADLIAADLSYVLKENVLLYTGAQDEDERDDSIDKFRNTSNHNILIGTEALAEGVNLQVAKYVINIDQPDTFAIKTQRIGRARRIGSQFSNVIVYDMITSSTDKVKSKDEERLENIVKNKDLTDALVSIDEAQRAALVKAMSSC